MDSVFGLLKQTNATATAALTWSPPNTFPAGTFPGAGIQYTVQSGYQEYATGTEVAVCAGQ